MKTGELNFCGVQKSAQELETKEFELGAAATIALSCRVEGGDTPGNLYGYQSKAFVGKAICKVMKGKGRSRRVGGEGFTARELVAESRN